MTQVYRRNKVTFLFVIELKFIAFDTDNILDDEPAAAVSHRSVVVNMVSVGTMPQTSFVSPFNETISQDLKDIASYTNHYGLSFVNQVQLIYQHVSTIIK